MSKKKPVPIFDLNKDTRMEDSSSPENDSDIPLRNAYVVTLTMSDSTTTHTALVIADTMINAITYFEKFNSPSVYTIVDVELVFVDDNVLDYHHPFPDSDSDP